MSGELLRYGIGVVVGGALGVGLTAILVNADEHGPRWYLVVIGALCGAAAVALRTVLHRPAVPATPRHGPPPVVRSRVEVLGEMERRISGGTRRRIGYANRLQPVLRDLVDERLSRGGSSLATLTQGDPAVARAVLGDELWSWLTVTGDDGPTPSTAQLAAMINGIEAMSDRS